MALGEAVDAEAALESEVFEQSLSSLYFLFLRREEADDIFSVLMGLLLLVSSFFRVDRSKAGESATVGLVTFSTLPGIPTNGVIDIDDSNM